jgi:hypothetical protein
MIVLNSVYSVAHQNCHHSSHTGQGVIWCNRVADVFRFWAAVIPVADVFRFWPMMYIATKKREILNYFLYNEHLAFSLYGGKF